MATDKQTNNDVQHFSNVCSRMYSSRLARLFANIPHEKNRTKTRRAFGRSVREACVSLRPLFLTAFYYSFFSPKIIECNGKIWQRTKAEQNNLQDNFVKRLKKMTKKGLILLRVTRQCRRDRE